MTLKHAKYHPFQDQMWKIVFWFPLGHCHLCMNKKQMKKNDTFFIDEKKKWFFSWLSFKLTEKLLFFHSENDSFSLKRMDFFFFFGFFLETMNSWMGFRAVWMAFFRYHIFDRKQLKKGYTKLITIRGYSLTISISRWRLNSWCFI